MICRSTAPSTPRILESYLSSNAVSDGYAEQLEISWRLLVRHAGRDLDAREVTAPLLSGFVESMASRSPRTAKNHRNNVLRLLRWAELTGEIAAAPNPRLVRSPRVPPPMPRAWWREEAEAMIAAARLLPGRMRNGARRSLYFPTLIAVALESGLRRGDLMTLSVSNLSGTRGSIRMSKTGEPHVFELHPDTATALRELARETGSDTPLAHHGCHRTLRRWFDRIKAAAGVEIRPKEVLQQLRRTGATAWEMIDENYTSRYLGHRSAGMKRHYVDQSKAVKDARRFPRSA